MIQLSVVIITFNEERNIGRCLESIKGIADDVVVVDSFSKDKTEAICLDYGARFISHAFEGHIEQKNWAITQAKFPIVLSLDADEALSEELKASILEAKKNWNSNGLLGYEVNRLTNYCGSWIKHCGWYPDRKLRLFDARKGSWTGTNPHDKYELMMNGELGGKSDRKLDEILNEKSDGKLDRKSNGKLTTGFLKGDLLHYSYYTLEDHHKQVRYFTDIASKAAYAKGQKGPLWKLILSPVAKFFWDYFIRLGFLDGRAGFRICRISAYATYLKYAKIRRAWNAS